MAGVQWLCERLVKKSGPEVNFGEGTGGRILEMKKPQPGWLGLEVASGYLDCSYLVFVQSRT